MECQLARNVDGVWQCSVCGWVYTGRRQNKPRRRCGTSPQVCRVSRTEYPPGTKEHTIDGISQRWLSADEPFTLMTMDVDGLTCINNADGQRAGDCIITRLTERLDATLTDKEVWQQTGGDEFQVWIPGLCGKEGLERAASIHASIIKGDLIDETTGKEVYLGLSAGVAATEPGDNLFAISARASAALGVSKDSGKLEYLDGSEAAMPAVATMGWSLTKALAAFVADGCKTVTAEQYERRLNACDSCEHRRKTRCIKCGCNLAIKARGRAWKCPEEKWDTTTNRPPN